MAGGAIFCGPCGPVSTWVIGPELRGVDWGIGLGGHCGHVLACATGPGPGCGATAKRLLELRALDKRGWAVEPELEVEVARSPFELWALLAGKPCRTAELHPDPLRALHLWNRGRGLGLPTAWCCYPEPFGSWCSSERRKEESSGVRPYVCSFV